ncbi:MAG: hypothetical protein KF762_07090 [Acidobacteria bacterium]|nr:hypothetical protein [Acidobacteriota bacterium]
MNNIKTPQGDVQLLAPPVDLLRAIRSFLPYGFVGYGGERPSGAHFGIVMQCGDKEVLWVKQQPVPCDEEQGVLRFQANGILIALSLADYLHQGFDGLFMPCAYIRKKDGGQVESGIAYFGSPSSDGREVQENSFGSGYDDSFGPGFTTMMVNFIHTLKRSSEASGISLDQFIGLDVRPRTHLEALGFGFMVVGSHMVCLKTQVVEQDPVWTALRSTGISEVYHLPSVPAGITEADLAIAEPCESSE